MHPALLLSNSVSTFNENTYFLIPQQTVIRYSFPLFTPSIAVSSLSLFSPFLSFSSFSLCHPSGGATALTSHRAPAMHHPPSPRGKTSIDQNRSASCPIGRTAFSAHLTSSMERCWERAASDRPSRSDISYFHTCLYVKWVCICYILENCCSCTYIVQKMAAVRSVRETKRGIGFILVL